MPTNRRTAPNAQQFFVTPAWATRALLEHETFTGSIWEPACGSGEMVAVLRANHPVVIASDLHDRGCPDSTFHFDFLQARAPDGWDNIITNPPYGRRDGYPGQRLEEQFVIHACALARRKVALFLRLAFLEGGKHYDLIYRANKPNRIWVFSERVTLWPGQHEVPEEDRNGGTTAYAWFVWDRERPNPPKIEIDFIPPGTRERLQ